MQTILFTDIEGSTRLWETHPDQMSAALARHDQILSDAIQQAGGDLLKTTGDGVIAIFEAPGAALTAALHGQESLARQDWDSAGPIRVRMGIHAGETESRDGDYFGPVMNRTARIMAAGHGGQILLSQAIASLTADSLPSGAALQDLGPHQLKDLTRPEHLYQLNSHGLATEFPALRTLSTRANNLPLQVTEFLGRSQELAAIEAMMESPGVRLLTITGPGGAGKTRLSLQVAADLSDGFRDGVFFVDLSRETEPEAAFEAVVRALDLPVAGGGSALQTLQTRLRDSELLLVLDNFEQVLDAATGVSDLIQQAAALKILITSRATLRIRAEQVYPVPPLSLPNATAPTDVIAESEAVQLFADRARAVRPDFTISDNNAADVARICLSLDGLPLAVELAAARLNLFTPADLLARLEDRLDVLGAAGRDVPERQRTLWGAIGWSYELLDEPERELFELVSIFSTADLPAIEAVAAASPNVGFALDLLSSLIDKSLVRSIEDGAVQRFSMLHLIKEYAVERLDASPDRAHAVREAHARHYSDFALKLRDRLNGADRDAALRDLESEIGNLRSAWRFWVDEGEIEKLFELIDGLWALHETRGWYHAAIDLARDMLDVLATSESVADRAGEELTIRISLARALMAVGGYNPEVEEAFTRALELSEAAGAAAQRMPVLRALASYYTQTMNFEAAASLGQQILQIGEQEQDSRILAEGHYVLGSATLFQDVDTCLENLDLAIELFPLGSSSAQRFQLGTNTAVAARTASSLVLWQCGALDRSVARMQQALEVARELEHPFSIAYALYHSGYLALGGRRFQDALDCAAELATISRENDYELWGTLAKVLEGVAVCGIGDIERGAEMTEAAIDLYQGLTTPPVFWPFVLLLRATVRGMAGQPERALQLMDDAFASVESPDVLPPDLKIARADFLRSVPNPDLGAVETIYLEAIETARALRLHLAVLSTLTKLVTLRREQDHSPDGTEDLAAVYDTFTEGHDAYELVTARQVLGRE